MMTGDAALVTRQLNDSVSSTAQIIFFLVGAMTIVEVIDAHSGFEIITSLIGTRNQVALMWLIGFVTFFLSAVLDNLTTTIVMISLIKKLVGRSSDRLLFAAMIVIAANAGGAWSAIGDVTTTMLWIGGQITPLTIMRGLLLPSLANLTVPLLIVSYRMRGRDIVSPVRHDNTLVRPDRLARNLTFYFGLGVLVSVPAFKTATGLPPFMGILFGLGLLWLVGEIVNRKSSGDDGLHPSWIDALMRIDMSSIVFFTGILLAVAALEHAQVLAMLADFLDRHVGRLDVIVILLGLASAIVDNVPLVAASISMYSLEQHPPDSFLWEFIAYCAGTGGSILIIGSAAGVAAMGLGRIQFLWYMRWISGPAMLGYLAGCAVYILQYNLLQ